MTKYLARVCWSDNGWVQPSGAVRERLTYVAEYGFGHEEWLFKYDWLLDGWKYAFLQPVNRSLAKVQGATIDLFLYTIRPTGAWYYVAHLPACEVLTETQAASARQKAISEGELARMKQQVRSVGGNVAGLEDEGPLFLFNIRFRPVVLDEPTEVPSHASLRKYRRYNLIEVRSGVEPVVATWPSRTGTTVVSGAPRPRAGVSPTVTDQVHSQLQNFLCEEIGARLGPHRVTMEADYVDLKFLGPDGAAHLVEIKADSVARRAIRSALGQLLAYEHHSATKIEHIASLIVAAPAELDPLDRSFLAFLRDQHGLHVQYLCLRRGGVDLKQFIQSLE